MSAAGVPHRTSAEAVPSAGDHGKVRQAYDALAADYDKRYHGPRWEIYDRLTLGQILRVLPASHGRILDAGAGTGKFALALAAKGHHVTLLEPSEQMLDVARQRLTSGGLHDKATFIQGSVDDMKLPIDQFDAVICEGDPLSYCRTTYRKAAAEILRVLKPGGRFYVSCDNRWQAAVALFCSGRLADAKRAIAEGASHDPYGIPVHAFSADELHDVFVEAGAHEVKITGKGIATNFLSDDQLAKLCNTEGAEAVTQMEERFGAEPGLLGIAGHLVVTGSKPGADEVARRPDDLA